MSIIIIIIIINSNQREISTCALTEEQKRLTVFFLTAVSPGKEVCAGDHSAFSILLEMFADILCSKK